MYSYTCNASLHQIGWTMHSNLSMKRNAFTKVVPHVQVYQWTKCPNNLSQLLTTTFKYKFMYKTIIRNIKKKNIIEVAMLHICIKGSRSSLSSMLMLLISMKGSHTMCVNMNLICWEINKRSILLIKTLFDCSNILFKTTELKLSQTIANINLIKLI